VKLLGTIDSIEFSDAEKERLTQSLAQVDSRQHVVVTSKALQIRDNEFWRRAQKNFHITGFRDGSLPVKQKVVARALENTKSHSSKTSWLAVGPLYIKAVKIHVEHETPNLYQLLLAEDFVASSGGQTEQIFRCICRALPLHEASIDEAKELYELWGFERTPQIEEILSSVSIRADDVRRMVAESLSTTRREIAGAVATTKSDLIRLLEQQSREIGMMASALDNVRAAASNMANQIVEIRSKEAQRAVPSNVSPPSKTAPPSRGKVNPQDSDRLVMAVEALQGKVEGLSRQMRDQRARIEALEPRAAPTAITNSQRSGNTTPKEVIEKWGPGLELLGVIDRPVQAGWLLLQLIRHARVLITDKPNVLTRLWKALPDGETKLLVASPLWITDIDWKAGLEYLSEPDTRPRLLVLSDFDVAIQETYLIPSLLGWISSQSPLSANRIVLVPSNNELAGVSPRVFEVATLLTQDAAFVRGLEKLTITMKDLPPTLELQQSAATIVSYEHLQNVPAERELRRYVSNSGVSLPNSVAENFISLYGGLQSFLSANDAAFVAQSAILLPWVQASRGETVARSVQNAFTALYAS
jgi:hypothetical protein